MAGDVGDVTTDARDEMWLRQGRFDELLGAHLHRIRQMCSLRIRNPHDADDVASEVVVRLLRQLKSGRRFSHPFRVIVVKRTEWTIKDHFKRSTEQRLLERLMDHDPEPVGDDEGIVSFLDRDEVERLIARLPERDREILDLVYVQELTIAQAAERLGITRNAADQRLFRARARLREALDA